MCLKKLLIEDLNNTIVDTSKIKNIFFEKISKNKCLKKIIENIYKTTKKKVYNKLIQNLLKDMEKSQIKGYNRTSSISKSKKQG